MDNIQEVRKKLEEIDNNLQHEIDVVNRKLDADIVVMQQSALEEIDRLKMVADHNRSQEVADASRRSDQDTQILIGDIQELR